METLIIIRDTNGVVPYWSSGSKLAEARKNYKRHAGVYPSKQASIVALSGTPEDIEKVRINDLGDLSYPKTVSKIVLQ